MKYCSNHHANPDDALFCHECGGKLIQTPTLEKKKCPKCNAENPLNAKFCHDCGFRLSNPELQPKPNPDPTPAPEPKPDEGIGFFTYYRLTQSFLGKACMSFLTITALVALYSIVFALGCGLLGGYKGDWIFLLICAASSIIGYWMIIKDRSKNGLFIWRFANPLEILGLIGCGANVSTQHDVYLGTEFYIALVVLILGYIIAYNGTKKNIYHFY